MFEHMVLAHKNFLEFRCESLVSPLFCFLYIYVANWNFYVLIEMSNHDNNCRVLPNLKTMRILGAQTTTQMMMMPQNLSM